MWDPPACILLTIIILGGATWLTAKLPEHERYMGKGIMGAAIFIVVLLWWTWADNRDREHRVRALQLYERGLRDAR